MKGGRINVRNLGENPTQTEFSQEFQGRVLEESAKKNMLGKTNKEERASEAIM